MREAVAVRCAEIWLSASDSAVVSTIAVTAPAGTWSPVDGVNVTSWPSACAPTTTSVWGQYTIRLAPGRRDALAAALKAQGIPTAIYYAKPLHRQAAYRHFPVADGGVPVSERLAGEVISLPMHAYLEEARHFGVSILAQGQEHLSAHFAGRPDAPATRRGRGRR